MKQLGAGWSTLARKVTDHLADLQHVNRRRVLHPQAPEINSPMVAGHLDLTHNDYLGLRVNPQFHRRALEAATFLPPGAGASRLLGGEHPIFEQLESTFSNFKDAEASLYFNSGYAANEAVTLCLAMDGIEFFSDELNHASIIDGLRLSRIPKHRRHVYPHVDTSTLEGMLRRSSAEVNIVYTESIFSMDGDKAPLHQLYELCQAHRGVLVVDEAHAIGVVGNEGRGLIDEMLQSHHQVISINTCGKALSVQGALVAGPTWFRDLMINKARSFIYSTGPSPWSAAALLESLAMVRQMDVERDHLEQIATKLRGALEDLGVNIGRSTTQIIPIILGSESAAMRAQAALERRGILAKAIRPPTVGEGSCRLRISLNSRVTTEHIRIIAANLEEFLHA